MRSADHWTDLYRSTPSRLPWEEESLPPEVQRWRGLLSAGDCVLDLGCGRGLHAHSLAASGVAVDGIDFSPVAIAAARSEAERLGLDAVRFMVADVLTFRPNAPYDFVLDYSVFHHIREDRRAAYAATVRAAVKAGGYLGVVCYSEHDPEASGRSFRVGRFGNVIFHPRREEIVGLFLDELELVEYGPSVLGRRRNHLGHHFLFCRVGDAER